MSDYLKYNLLRYLTYKIKLKSSLFVGVLFLLIALMGYLSFHEIYDVYSLDAHVVCDQSCVLHFYLPTSVKFDYHFIKVNTLNYEIEDIKIGEVQSDYSNHTFQDFTLKLKEYKGHNNDVVEIQLLKNKEKIIKKIWKIILER